jgi:hypothetical protein
MRRGDDGEDDDEGEEEGEGDIESAGSVNPSFKLTANACESPIRPALLAA